MKTVKQLIEERETLAIEAKAIYEAAQRANRDLAEDEVKRFDEITNKSEGLIAKLDKDIATAKEREDAIVAISQRESRRNRLDELTEPGGILNPNPTQARLTLPSNGALPENGQPQDRIFLRTAKLKAFKNERDAVNCGMWLRAFIAKHFNREDKSASAHVHRLGWQVTNVGIEGTGQLGGYVVPAPLSQTIIDVRDTVGVARQALKIMPMSSETLTMARRDGGLTVYYVGEAQSITLSDKDWGAVELIAKKRAVAHQISQELVDDALISIVDDAMNEMAYALAAKEDAEAINGDGTTTYGGVTGLLSALGSAGVSQAATGHDTWAELDVADITAWMGLLPDKYSRNPKIICSRAFYTTVLFRLMAQAGGNTFASMQAGVSGANFFGIPVLFTDQMPRTTAAATVCALYGTFEMGAILGERTGVAMARSDEYAFLNDVTTVKATTRYDIVVHAGGDASNAGSYVGLKTAA
jgi:HK97 family phage major capsid protein